MAYEHLLEHDAEQKTTSGASAPSTIAFDYTCVDAKTADSLRRGAACIRRLSALRSAHLLTIGEQLLLAKTLLGHGRFGAWLKAEFGWTERSAQRFIRARETFGTKNDTVAVLPPTALYQLSAKSTPDTVREAIMTRLKAGERPALAQINAEVGAARRTAQRESTGRRVVKALQLGAPLVPSAVTKAREAAKFIAEHVKESRERLAALLEGIDSQALVATLRADLATRAPDPADYTAPTPAVEMELTPVAC